VFRLGSVDAVNITGRSFSRRGTIVGMAGVMAKIFDKILCPVAFDVNSAAAIRFACELAEPATSTLYLLHVVSAPTLETLVIEPHPILTEAIASRELEKIALQHLPTNFPYRIVLRSGDPASLIVTVAEELQADLIVMPTHGSRGVVGLIIGSVAARVVREAKRPVLTIQPQNQVSGGLGHRYDPGVIR
jgi:universal stress protein A